MKLIPPVVYRFNSAAEKKIFGAMRKADDDPTVILHSLNLPEHDYKQWAEADFVAVSAAGVMVIEVKGGRVACEDGIWCFTDRFGEVHRKSEGPFEQAKTARIALEKLLRQKIDPRLVDRINFGAGLMFPDIRFDVPMIEIPGEVVFDADNWAKRDMSFWLRRLSAYWAERTGRKSALSADDLKLVIQSMRPTFDLVPALVQRVGSTMERLIQLTDDQYRYLDILVLQRRVVIEGGAGTGKTLLAVEASRRLSDNGNRVCFLCRSPVLAWYVRRRLADTGVTVLCFDDLKQKPGGFGNEVDVFVIDEGQDFLNLDVISHLDSVIKGGFIEGSWLFFMDKNNQGGMYEALDQDALDYIRSAGIPFPLADNCRNTYQIAVHTMMYTGGDIGVCSAMGEGLKVEESRPWNTKQEELEAIEGQLERWVDREGVSLEDITIISMKPPPGSVVAGLSKRWRRRVHSIDESFGTEWLEGSLTFSTACNFKGLENRYIMLVDLDALTESADGISSLYVGMTRANASLWIAIPDTHRNLLERLCSANSGRLSAYVEQAGKRHG